MDAVKVTFDRKCCGCVLANEEILVRTTPSSPVGMHRVVDPAGAWNEIRSMITGKFTVPPAAPEQTP